MTCQRFENIISEKTSEEKLTNRHQYIWGIKMDNIQVEYKFSDFFSVH